MRTTSSALRMGEHNRVMTLHVDVGRVAMAGRYAEIGKTDIYIN